MSGGLFALLDDISVLAKAAAASIDDVSAAAARAGAKATGVVIDDTAVTPRYVQGLAAEREVPIVKRIAWGSLRNKLLFILPASLLLSQFLPWALTPLLMLGGTYLAFEGVEKIWERWRHHNGEKGGVELLEERAAADEDEIVANAVRTDFILSSEIMVIALGEVADEPLLTRGVVLVVVALAITVLVYGVVGLIVKMDDVGLRLALSGNRFVKRLGDGLVKAMPRLLAGLSVIGIAAMIWVGGHIILLGLHELGLTLPYTLVHGAEQAVAAATGRLGGMLGWVTNTVGSALLGVVIGAVVVAVMRVIPRRKKVH